MLSTIKDSVTVVGKRFLLDFLVPVAAAMAIFLTVVLVHRPGGLDGAAHDWDAAPSITKAVQIGLGLASAFVVAMLLSASSVALVRLYEGYWPSRMRWGADVGCRWHQRRLERCAARGEDARIYSDYPPPSRPHLVMPTRIGNVFRAAELYPEVRYGMDAVLFWPRLRLVVPDRVT